MDYERARRSAGVDARETLGLGVVHLAWDEVDSGADKDVVRVTLGTVHASGVLHVVKLSLSGQDEV